MKLLLLSALLAGCSTTPLTESERTERDAATYEQWLYCQGVMRNAGLIWVTTIHVSKRMERGQDIPDYLDMRSDLMRNSCTRPLRAAGFL